MRLVVAGLGAVAGALPAQPAPEVSETALPSGFAKYLWLNAGVELDAELASAVRALGCDGVAVSGGSDPAAPAAYGLRFYRHQIVPKGFLELRDEEFAACRDEYERTRDPAALVRPTCLSSAAVRAELRQTVVRELARWAPHGPDAVSLGDEISVTRHQSPLDFCYGPACLRTFREFLAARHGSILALNQAWNTELPSFDAVVPFTADRIRARELGGELLPRNLRPWSEHLEFVDAQLAEVVGELLALARARAPGVACGLTGMQPPSAYGGHDYHRLLAGQTFCEAYDLGGARDLAQCLAPTGCRHVGTLFPLPPGRSPRAVAARCFDLLAHGLDGVVVWSARDALGEDGKPTRYGLALRAALDELAPAEVAAGAQIVRSPVWIVESQASVRAHWMLDSAGDGATWIRRLSTYERAHSTSIAARHGWLRLLEDLGLQPRFVASSDLPDLLDSRRPPRLLVLPAMLALSDRSAAAIGAYVYAGGCALADHSLALYDEHLVRRDVAVLDAVFGLRGRSMAVEDQLVVEGQPAAAARLPSGAAAAEASIRGQIAEPVGDFHVQIEHRYGRGRTVYLNLAVCEYGAVRLEPERIATALDLRRRVRRVLDVAGVRPPVAVVGDGLPTCVERIVLRTDDGRRLLAIRLNVLESPELLAELGRRGPCPIELIFPTEVAVRDVIAGRDLGRGRKLEVELPPYTGLLLEVEELQ